VLALRAEYGTAMADHFRKRPQPLSQATFYGWARAPVAPVSAPPPAAKKRARECALARWSSFRTQDQAHERAREGPSELRVWAHELSKAGVRSYIVASVRDFWAVYRTLPDIERRHYELIAPERPCRLYFDLEFEKAKYDDLDDDACARAMEAFWTLLRRQLGETLGLVLDPLRTVELDSTSATKFSRHVTASLRRVGRAPGGGGTPTGGVEDLRGMEPLPVVVRAGEALVAELSTAADSAAADTGGAAALDAHAGTGCVPAPESQSDGEVLFASNAHVGAWVRRWVEQLQSARTIDPLAALLFPAHAPEAAAPADAIALLAAAGEAEAAPALPAEPPPVGPKQVEASGAEAGASGLATGCLVDTSVYSRHRCFRLYRSAKVGKRVPLLPVGLSLDQTRALPLAAEALIFRNALVVPAEEPRSAAPGAQAEGSAPNDAAPADPGGVARGADGVVSAAAQQRNVISLDLDAYARQSSGAMGGGAVRVGMARRPISELLPAGACAALCGLREFATQAWTAKSGRPCDVRAPQHLLEHGGGTGAGERAGARRLFLAVSGNRWCGRVGREHRSNGVYLCAHVRPPDPAARGARATGSLSQRCHDPDCRQFRGDELPLPPELADALVAALEGADAGGPPP
jgi:hypothetical protein